MNTHGLICDFGQHRGIPYTRLPVSYLKWMVNTRHSRVEIAAAELARRGTITPNLDVSGHALDRASLYCLDLWQATRHENEGIHAWLARTAAESLAVGNTDDQGRYQYRNLTFIFEQDGIWPVLKTVIRR